VSADPHDFFAAAPVRPLDPPTPPPMAIRPEPPKPGHRGLVGLTLSVLLAVVAAVVVHGARHSAQATVTADGSSATTQATGGAPPVTATAHPTRLLPAVTAPAGDGGYATDGDARWDPCQPVRYVVSGAEPFQGANALLTQALSEASRASGLEFDYAGTTTERAAVDRPSYQPERYGRQWAPVLVAWTDQAAVPALAGNVIGLGGAASASVHGQWRLVSGILYFDGPELSLIAQRATGFAQMRTVMLHEIGHLVGLGHVQDTTAVMFPSDNAQNDYNAGDLRGLAYAGNGPCSHWH